MVFHVYDIYDYSSLMHCFWPEFKSCAFALWNYISGYNHWPSYEMDMARSLGAGDNPCDTWLNSGAVPDGMKLAKDKADEGGKLVVGHISVDIPQSLIQCHGKKETAEQLGRWKGSPLKAPTRRTATSPTCVLSTERLKRPHSNKFGPQKGPQVTCAHQKESLAPKINCVDFNKQPFRFGTGGDWGFKGGDWGLETYTPRCFELQRCHAGTSNPNTRAQATP